MTLAAQQAWTVARAESTDWMPPPVDTVVVAPHPDDEVLMFGGLIARQLARGVRVTVVAVTDGGAGAGGRLTPAELGAHRRAEQEQAVVRLAPRPGCAATVVRLGLDDGGVVDTDVAFALQDLVADHVLVAAPWPGEPHRDHAACGRAAHSVMEGRTDQLVHGLFWTWHWLAPTDVKGPLRRMTLHGGERERRLYAMSSHRSQTVGIGGAAPLLEQHDLAPLTWNAEFVIGPDAEGGP